MIDVEINLINTDTHQVVKSLSFKQSGYKNISVFISLAGNLYKNVHNHYWTIEYNREVLATNYGKDF